MAANYMSITSIQKQSFLINMKHLCTYYLFF